MFAFWILYTDAIMHVYFIRTGESEDDLSERYQRQESPLSEEGEIQRELLARHLVHIRFDAILSSPLLRAKQTVEILTPSVQDVVYDPLLTEIKQPSELVGERIDDPAFSTTRYMLETKWSYPAWHYSDEENFSDVKKRALRVLKSLSKRDEEHILIVSHGHFLTMLFLMMTFGKILTVEEYRRFDTFAQMTHAGVTECELVKGVWKMRVWNDTSHLTIA